MKLSLRTIIAVSVVGLAFGGVCIPYITHQRVTPIATSCSSNLKQLAVALRIYSDDNNGKLPDDLNGLATAFKDPNSFLECLVCPETKHKPGKLEDIHQWSDYTYVSGLKPNSSSDSVVLYCPPEHHYENFGRIAFFDGEVKKVGSEDFRKILAIQNIKHVPMEP